MRGWKKNGSLMRSFCGPSCHNFFFFLHVFVRICEKLILIILSDYIDFSDRHFTVSFT